SLHGQPRRVLRRRPDPRECSSGGTERLRRARVRRFVQAAQRSRARRRATSDTVHDMDAIRAAIGEARISYMGFSYGTYLGARYADAYPQHVRTMVLDGAIDPS